MKAIVNADGMHDAVRQLLSISSGRSTINPFAGLIEVQVENGVCKLRAFGASVQVMATFAADVSQSGRCVVGSTPIAMIARATKSHIQMELSGNDLAMVSSGIRVNAAIQPDGHFPKQPDSGDRSILLTAVDVEAWSIVDEPTTAENADDTIWLGVSPLNPRLYASAAAGSWAAAVRDGQDASAIAVPASVLRKIRPQVGDVLRFSVGSLTIAREGITCWLSTLSRPAIDRYPMMESLIGRSVSRVQLGEHGLSRLRTILSVLISGSEESKLIPVTFFFEQGHLFLVGQSSKVSTAAAIKAQLIKGEKTWRVAAAGEAILATISNLRPPVDFCVIGTDGATNALMIWNQHRVVSIRAGLRDNHQLPDQSQKSALMNQVDLGRQQAAEPEFSDDISESDPQEPSFESPELEPM